MHINLVDNRTFIYLSINSFDDRYIFITSTETGDIFHCNKWCATSRALASSKALRMGINDSAESCAKNALVLTIQS